MSYKVLYDFGGSPNGANPEGSLTDVRGTLYGTTYAGGKFFDGDGTVFRITTSGTENVLHSFGYGADGAFPRATLIDMDGTLYGTTPAGGSYGNGSFFFGTVFSINSAGREHVLYSFRGSPDGETPAAGLIDMNGTLYGTKRRRHARRRNRL